MLKKVFFILTFAIFYSINSFADAGLAFRYKVALQNENQKITGYIYHYTYSNGYNKEKESFCDYFLREFHNTPYLYKEVRSLTLSNNIELDFFLPKNKLEFSKQEITNVKLLESKEFAVGERIFSIENKSVYNLIGKALFNIDSIYYSWMENCTFFIVDFDKKHDIKELNMDLDSLIKKHFNEKSQELNINFHLNFRQKREKLLTENVLIF
jgi:hypothetical protein